MQFVQGHNTRSCLEAISIMSFGPNVYVGTSFQILEILKYSSGFKLGSAATLNQNPIFEMASNNHESRLSTST